MAQRTQDIFNSEVLSELLGKTVITRTFEEVCGKDIKQLHQLPVWFPPEEKEVYEKAMDEFVVMRNHYFNLTGNSRKDSMMKLIQQIVLLLRISAAPDTVKRIWGRYACQDYGSRGAGSRVEKMRLSLSACVIRRFWIPTRKRSASTSLTGRYSL